MTLRCPSCTPADATPRQESLRDRRRHGDLIAARKDEPPRAQRVRGQFIYRGRRASFREYLRGCGRLCHRPDLDQRVAVGRLWSLLGRLWTPLDHAVGSKRGLPWRWLLSPGVTTWGAFHRRTSPRRGITMIQGSVRGNLHR
jgi:hypothetical protein